MRRVIARLAVLVCLAAVAFLMYDIGKEYDVIIDNQRTSIEGTEYGPIPYCSLVIDGDERKPVDIWAEDRVIQKMVTETHSFVIKILDEEDDSVISVIERTVTLDGYTRARMISLPAIVGEAAEIFIPNPLFSPMQISDEEEEPAAGDMEDAPVLF
jgi:hypothetical protein